MPDSPNNHAKLTNDFEEVRETNEISVFNVENSSSTEAASQIDDRAKSESEDRVAIERKWQPSFMDDVLRENPDILEATNVSAMQPTSTLMDNGGHVTDSSAYLQPSTKASMDAESPQIPTSNLAKSNPLLGELPVSSQPADRKKGLRRKRRT